MSNTNDRLVIKIAGPAGFGIKTAGLIIAKSLKRLGYNTFGYTEYPSLIRGGHNVYQIEAYDKKYSSAFPYFSEICKRGIAAGLNTIYQKKNNQESPKMISLNHSNDGKGLHNF